MAGSPRGQQAKGAALLLCALLAAAGATAADICTVQHCAVCHGGPKNCGTCNSNYSLVFSISGSTCVRATPSPAMPPSPTYPNYIPFPSRVPAAPTPTPTRFCSSIAQVAKNGKLTLFMQSMKAAGLWTYISDRKLVATVFAPTDAAFNTFLKKYNVTSAQLMSNERVVVSIMKNHVVPGIKLTKNELKARKTAMPTLSSYIKIKATVKSGVLQIQPGGGPAGKVVKANQAACKAYLQAVDQVLVPAHYWSLGSNGKIAFDGTLPFPPLEVIPGAPRSMAPPPSKNVGTVAPPPVKSIAAVAPSPANSAATSSGLRSAIALACGLAGAVLFV